jgi:hypothetical protein
MCPEAAPALFLIDELSCVVAYFSEHGSSTALHFVCGRQSKLKGGFDGKLKESEFFGIFLGCL